MSSSHELKGESDWQPPKRGRWWRGMRAAVYTVVGVVALELFCVFAPRPMCLSGVFYYLTGRHKVELRDTGDLCVTAAGRRDARQHKAIRPGEAVELHVLLAPCASHCIRDLESQCTLTVNERPDGESTIAVSAHAKYRRTGGPGQVCTAACNPISTKCISSPLKEGSYTVRYAGNNLTFEVPTEPDLVKCTDGFPRWRLGLSGSEMEAADGRE